MNTKRGLLVLVVLLVLSSVGVVAFGTYPIVRLQAHCEFAEDCRYSTSVAEYCFSLNDCEASSCDEEDGKELPTSFPPDAAGCFMNVVETYGLAGCGWAIMSNYFTLGSEDKKIAGNSLDWTDDGDDDAVWVRDNTRFHYRSGYGLICNGQDGYWYQCDWNVAGQSLSIGEGEAAKTYFCFDNGVGGFEWVDASQMSESFDNDGDGMPNAFDCNDGDPEVYPNAYPLGCAGDACVFNASVRHEDACGDGKDNLCTSWSGELGTEFFTIGGAEFDDCDQAGETACNAEYDWLDSEIGNNCCGDDSSDLGRIAPGTKGTVSGNYLCVSEEEAGYDKQTGTRATQPTSEIFEENGVCAGEDWCWLSASDGAFKIFTVGPAESTQDVVSDGRNWLACGVNNEGPLQGADDPQRGNRFSCYPEGRRWSWAECVAEEADAENRGAKLRTAGQGLFALPFEQSEDETTLVQIDVTSLTYTAFTDYYGAYPLLDFSGYNYLNFFVKFLPDAEHPLEENLPISLLLEVSGQDEAAFLSKNVLGDIVNGPFALDKLLHIRTPIPEFAGVQKISLSSDLFALHVEDIYLSSIDSETLCSGQTSSGEESSWIENGDDGAGRVTGQKICEERYGGKKSWLGNDNAVDASAPSANCCGNDGNEERGEYYSGASQEIDGKNYACWNSQAIAEKEPITNVEFEVKYKKLVEIAEVDLSLPVGVRRSVREGDEIRVPEPRSYPCSSSSKCILPLPHATTFVANKHPGLYDLYLVTRDPETEQQSQVLVDAEGLSVTMPAMLKAVNVPQQVVFVSEGSDIGFYGCAAPQYIAAAGNLQENLNFCSVKAEQFCAPSTKSSGVPTWSTESLGHIGYVNPSTIPVSLTELSMKESPTPEETASGIRVQQTSVLPGRNFLPNAEFSFAGDANPTDTAIPGWIAFSSRSPRDIFHDTEKVATLNAGETLRSERIAVPQNAHLQFSQSAAVDQCPDRFLLYDQNGVEAVQEELSTTGANMFLIIEFSLPGGAKRDCTIKHPLLQIVDDLGPASYAAEDYARPNSQLRQGQSCCAENYCWNGFTCVAPMGDTPLLAEPVGENYYRCVAGEWAYQPIKQSWNGKAGFCSAQSQCFVSPEGSSAVTAPQLFAEGYGADLPNCINEGEFLFDNLCQEGNWTSRTQALAGKLFEFADGKEYVLYCTDYQTALVNFNPLYLGGDRNVISGEPNCFQNLNPPTALISDADNKCINNVCILQYQEGDAWKTAFATTINKPLNASNSFLAALGLPSGVCIESAGFAKCTVAGADVWYAKDLQAVAYAKEAIDLREADARGFVDRILDALRRALRGGADAEVAAFLGDIQSAHDVYLLNKDGKKVRAAIEPELRKQGENVQVVGVLKAEYESFTTPVCEYVNKQRIAYADFQGPFPPEQLRCSSSGDVQKVEALTGADFLWPQLTGKLRVGEE